MLEWLFLRPYGFVCLIILFLIGLAIPEDVKSWIFYPTFWAVGFPVVFALLIFVLLPLFSRFKLKGGPLTATQTKERILALLHKAGLHDVELYIWPTTKSRVANLKVSGLFKKRFYISDYYLLYCTPEELDAIIAHEIGHIKKYHAWLKTLAVCLFSFTVVLVRLETFWGMLGFFVLLYVFFRLVNLFLHRVIERQADAYVLSLGVNPLAFISALLKLTKLNQATVELNKADDKFHTHPAIMRRIRWIIKAANLTETELMEKIKASKQSAGKNKKIQTLFGDK